MSAVVTLALDHGLAAVHITGRASASTLMVVPALGMPAGIYDRFVARLSVRLRVVVVELPGAGEASQAPPWVSTRELAASLAHVASACAPRCHVFGLSLGGMVAQWMAIDAPSQIDRLVLASTAARGLDVALSGPLGKLALAGGLLSPDSARVALARGVASEATRQDPDEMARIASEIDDKPRAPVELLWLVGAVTRHDTRAELERITAPTLVVSGEQDELIAPGLQDDLASRIRGAARVVIPRAGHAVTLDRPEECADVVDAFLRRAPR